MHELSRSCPAVLLTPSRRLFGPRSWQSDGTGVIEAVKLGLLIKADAHDTYEFNTTALERQHRWYYNHFATSKARCPKFGRDSIYISEEQRKYDQNEATMAARHQYLEVTIAETGSDRTITAVSTQATPTQRHPSSTSILISEHIDRAMKHRNSMC